MDTSKYHTLPTCLTEDLFSNEDLNIIIGENGCGKSLLLNWLSKHYTGTHYNVIAIANTTYDKFNNRSRRFHFAGGNGRRNSPGNIIKKSLKNIFSETTDRIKKISTVLNYVKYDGCIGIHVSGYNENNLMNVEKCDELNENDKEDILSLLAKIKLFEDEIAWIKVDNFSFSEINKSMIPRIVKWEDILKCYDIIQSIEIFLSKEGNKIRLHEASSGELSIISSLIYISTVINDKTVILIDEPENSLHPTWQRRYPAQLLDLFYYYQPKIVIATHSPIIVSGAESATDNANIIKASAGMFTLCDKTTPNIEDLLSSMFDIVTPQSTYLSKSLINLLNKVADNSISNDDFFAQIDAYKSKVTDKRQLNILIKFAELALTISRNTNYV